MFFRTAPECEQFRDHLGWNATDTTNAPSIRIVYQDLNCSSFALATLIATCLGDPSSTLLWITDFGI